MSYFQILSEFTSITKGIDFQKSGLTVEKNKLVSICERLNQLSKALFPSNPPVIDSYVISFKGNLAKERVICKSNSSKLSNSLEVKLFFLDLATGIGADFRGLCSSLSSDQSLPENTKKILDKYFKKYHAIASKLYVQLNRYDDVIKEQIEILSEFDKNNSRLSNDNVLGPIFHDYKKLSIDEKCILKARISNKNVWKKNSVNNGKVVGVEMDEIFKSTDKLSKAGMNVLKRLNDKLFLNRPVWYDFCKI